MNSALRSLNKAKKIERTGNISLAIFHAKAALHHAKTDRMVRTAETSCGDLLRGDNYSDSGIYR